MKNTIKIKKKLDHFNVDIDYSFDQGVLIIEGESGAGKTTVLNCISGLIDPDFGEITIQGEPVFLKTALKKTALNRLTRERNIGYVFQNYALFPNLTVEENILYGIKNLSEYKNKEKKKELIHYSKIMIQSFGIEHLKKKHPQAISGGEKQRVALLRAIVTKPKLLLLDEPFSALDKKTKSKVYEEFQIFRQNFEIPMILITHDSKESQLFGDAVILMEEGKIVKTS